MEIKCEVVTGAIMEIKRQAVVVDAVFFMGFIFGLLPQKDQRNIIKYLEELKNTEKGICLKSSGPV